MKQTKENAYYLGTKVPHTRLALMGPSPKGFLPLFAKPLARVYERRCLLLAVAACQKGTLAKKTPALANEKPAEWKGDCQRKPWYVLHLLRA